MRAKFTKKKIRRIVVNKGYRAFCRQNHGSLEFDVLDLGICDHVNSAISGHVLETFRNILTGAPTRTSSLMVASGGNRLILNQKDSGGGSVSAIDLCYYVP